MRRLSSAFTLLALALTAALAGLFAAPSAAPAGASAGNGRSAAPPAPAPARPFARVKVVQCATGVDPASRVVGFQGHMRRHPGAVRMQMRFSLRARDAVGRAWHSEGAAGLGVWQQSNPGVAGYEFTQRVANLRVPAHYRAVVRFRWLDPAGRVVARARRTSATCRQPDVRPNLTVSSFDAAPTDGGRRYRLRVRNTGRSAAGPFDIVLTLNGVAQPAAVVPGLAPGARTSVAIVAPACEPGTAVSVVVDTDGRVDERNELDNSRTRLCGSVSSARR